MAIGRGEGDWKGNVREPNQSEVKRERAGGREGEILLGG